MTSFNKKMLEITIEKIKGPKNPKPQLEQHMTPSNIASETIWFALQHGLIINKKILDIGSGTGRLCLGSLIAGANECVSIEIDDEEIEEQIKYAKKLGIECKVEIIKADGASVPLRDSSLDVTLMNPPFGSVKRGIDWKFLKEALRVTRAVLSFHMYSEKSKDFFFKKVGEFGYKIEILKVYNMELKQIFEYHVSRKKKIPVMLLFIIKGEKK